MKSRSRLSHVRGDGSVRMVDVAEKPATARTAVAEAIVRLGPAAMRALRKGTAKKGDALTTAQIAGIAAAKRTSELIPLCHPLSLTHIDVTCALKRDSTIEVRCTASCTGPTGVEMEALTGASVAALTLYDMCKAMDRGITIERVRLLEKSGGRSGRYKRA